MSWSVQIAEKQETAAKEQAGPAEVVDCLDGGVLGFWPVEMGRIMNRESRSEKEIKESEKRISLVEDRLINYLRVYEQKKKKKLEDLHADFFQPKTNQVQKSKKYAETKSRYKQQKEALRSFQKMKESKESNLEMDGQTENELAGKLLELKNKEEKEKVKSKKRGNEGKRESNRVIRKKPKKKIIVSNSSSNMKTKKLVPNGKKKEESESSFNSKGNQMKNSSFRNQAKTQVKVTRRVPIKTGEQVGFPKSSDTECLWPEKSRTTQKISKS